MGGLDKGTCLRFYKRKDIQDAIIEHAKNKEIGTRYSDAFGKRPDVLNYPKDVIELAMRGVTSFHCSEELWDNPLQLSSEGNKKEQDELRIGWDLVLDIDCKFVDYSKISADLIIKFLKSCGVREYSIKFSGNKGFHIGIPFEAFPQKVGQVLTKNLFPDAPRKIALYIKEKIKKELGNRILKFENNDFNKVKEKVGLEQEEIIGYIKNEYGDSVPYLDVDHFLEIDTVLLASRHLYRMPYSLHEKSGLASIPIDPEKVLDFEKSMAFPDRVIIDKLKFMNREVSGESARNLLQQALDFQFKEVREKAEEKAKRFSNEEEIKIESPIKEDFFPPCMHLLLNGIEDGKKRAVFCMSNFLGKIGWKEKEIQEYLIKWNREKNQAPLRDNYIANQLRYFRSGDRLPPNCNNEAYYKGIGVCKPDQFCPRIKNPVNYTLLKWKNHLQHKEEEDKLQAKELKKLEKEKKKEEREREKKEKIESKK